MSSIVSAMDKHIHNKKFGENGHAEYAWSKDPAELVVQFFFQLVRCNSDSGKKDLENKLRYLLEHLSREHELFPIIYKIIAQTRDIVDGKGEYELAFMQLRVWWDYYPELAMAAFALFVKGNANPLEHQYGSWKDVKYMCNHLKNNSEAGESHPFINNILEFTMAELVMEWHQLTTSRDNSTPYSPGLIGRWLPREKSKKFGWVFNRLARLMFPEYVVEPQGGWRNRDHLMKAVTKQRIQLKKMLVALSRETDTAQIKMCNKEWSNLNFNHITSITLRKQKNAILNKTKKGEVRSTDEDRVNCAKNYQTHLQKAMSGDTSAKIHGKRCTVGELVKDALSAPTSGAVYDTINQQWESNRENNKALEKAPIVAMVDTSGSMEVDECVPLYNAVGLGVRVSELCHPAFRNRVMSFNSVPTWLRFDENDTPVQKIKACRTMSWGTSTDFMLAIEKILKALVDADVPPSEVRNLIVACFSDMQFDNHYANGNIFDTAEEKIGTMFALAGLKTSHRRAYDPPHLLFWNLRKTNGFPSTAFSKNVTYLGGYNSALLNIFCNQGIEALRESATPMHQLMTLLQNERYNHMDANLLH